MNKKHIFIISWLMVFALILSAFGLTTPTGLADSDAEIQFLEVVTGEEGQTGRDIGTKGTLLRYESENVKIPSGLEKMLEKHDSNLYIIEFNGPIKEEDKAFLEGASVVLGDYLPEYSFIAQVDSESLGQVTKFPFVDNVRPFLPIYKVDPRLFEKGISEVIKAQIVQFKEGGVPGSRFKEMTGPLQSIIELAQSDEVVYVGAAEDFVPFNDVATDIIKASTLRTSHGLTGDGQIVGIADTGLDRGINDSTMHLDFQGRINAIFALGRTNDASDPHGHGTHVAGSVLGDGSRSNGSFRGMAPGAQLVFQSIMDSNGGLGGLPSNLNDLFAQAWNAGARIHTNSWGADVNGAYTTSSQQVDQYVKNNDMTILFAAGNAGPNTQTVGSPATAKNAITVGASENYRPSFGSIADNINDIAYFSSRGNTADGRIKPDIVAPGTYILSTRSALAPDSSFWANYNSYYAYMGGTSMATPITAGGVALLREHFVKNRGVTPKPSLMKAALIAGATDVGLGFPSPHQGWGRATLDKSMNVAFVNESRALATSETASYSYSVSSGKPLKISLVWTDAPGSPSASKQLVNDLDLIITAPNGTKYIGNDFNQSGSWDERNNVENVFISSPQSGIYTIEVSAWNVPSGTQNFSIAAVNE